MLHNRSAPARVAGSITRSSMRIIRNILYMVLAAAVLLLTPSCGADETARASLYTPRQIAAVVVAASPGLPPLEALDWDGDYMTDYLSNIYDLDAEVLVDGFVCYANGVYASEIAVLLPADEADREGVEEKLRQYIARRTDAFAGYAPGEAAILKDSIVVSRDNYVALLICSDPQRAANAFTACFSSDPPALPADPFAPAAPDGPEPAEAGSDEADAAASDGDEADAAASDNDAADAAAADGAEAELAAADSDKAGPTVVDGAEAGPAAVDGAEPTPAMLDPALAVSAPDTNTPDAGLTEPGPMPFAPDPGQTVPEVASPDSNRASSVSDTYDHAAILGAWRDGDPDALSEKDRAILDACVAVITDHLTDDMSDYEKELTIHDWIVRWAEYDPEALSHAPNAKPDPDNDNPYGLLIRKKAVCMGYTSTFQLFMDLLDIECITVEGFSGTEDHAWNMVRLDDTWYCVDVTWDDPVSILQTETMRHRFFNVSSEYLRNNRHQWDESATPEAVAVH